MKEELEILGNKVVSLALEGHDMNSADSNSDTDDSDLEEVPEKEGYEAVLNLDKPREKNQDVISKKMVPSCSATSDNR